MDFFEQEESARKRSRLLVVLFILAVAGIILTVYLASTIFWFAYLAGKLHADTFRMWDPRLMAAVAFGTGTIIGLGSLYRISTLRRGGGEAVAGFLGGRLLDRSTRNADERRLLNVVEEMALASGIPVPAVFVLEKERSINAFAAGYSRDHAVIGVTRGCMELLSRDELQGVIGHEFSHILNGDMLLNIRLMGLVHGILVIALIGYMLLRGGRSSRKGGSQIVLIGAILYVVGYLGVIFGKIIRAAVSRQREFLADASAVQFTRNPEGIAGALKKIGGLMYGSRIRRRAR
ncbi:MAG TPA: M48 family metallopeptidase, partial [Candidatus Saccharimonadales bacterium]|nr:M48 family metallopeptidase [Candidatus Saccharimonadales bacterium]